MKLKLLLLALALVATPLPAAIAQMDHSKMDKPAAKSDTAHKATGVVKSVDRGKGSVLMAHGPVATLKWPAMTMSFAVKDRSLLDRLPAGGKVEFEFVQQGRDYVITGVK